MRHDWALINKTHSLLECEEEITEELALERANYMNQTEGIVPFR